VATLAEIYVQGVSMRKVKAITEELCGQAFRQAPFPPSTKPHETSQAMITYC
jgi:hypothetical protein